MKIWLWLKILLDVYVLRRFTVHTKKNANCLIARHEYNAFAGILERGNPKYPDKVLSEARFWVRQKIKRQLRKVGLS